MSRVRRKTDIVAFFVKNNEISGQIYRVINRDLLIGLSSFLRRSIALHLGFRSAQKRAPTEQYRRHWCRETKERENMHYLKEKTVGGRT